MTVSVRQLKSQLSRYLKKAQAGEEVVIASRGRPIARLSSVIPMPEPEEKISLEELDRRLASIPGIRLGKSRERIRLGYFKPVRPKKGGRLMSDIVIEERGPR